MPSLITKRGRKRYVGTVWVNGHRGPERLFPDASKKSYRDAVAWENEQVEILKRKLRTTPTESLVVTVNRWANGYLSYVEAHGFVKKTYDEKKASLKLFAAFDGIHKDLPVDEIDRFLVADFYAQLMADRSGNAVNKVRKNLGAAWTWGRENFRQWPVGENPFLAVSKKPEIRHPRYVPPEADFWAVYDHVAGLAESGEDVHVQDRVMLLAYLHLAARRSELFNAKWSDVDFARGQIRLWTKKREGGVLECDWLPLTDELSSELKMWAQRRLAHKTSNKGNLFVCLDPSTYCIPYFGQPFTSRQHTLRKWCSKVEVKPFGWHAIRHLTASILYRRGYSQGFMQALLRHKSPTTTARYLHTLGLNEVRAVLDEGLKRESALVIPFDQSKKASGWRS